LFIRRCSVLNFKVGGT